MTTLHTLIQERKEAFVKRFESSFKYPDKTVTDLDWYDGIDFQAESMTLAWNAAVEEVRKQIKEREQRLESESKMLSQEQKLLSFDRMLECTNIRNNILDSLTITYEQR